MLSVIRLMDVFVYIVIQFSISIRLCVYIKPCCDGKPLVWTQKHFSCYWGVEGTAGKHMAVEWSETQLHSS